MQYEYSTYHGPEPGIFHHKVPAGVTLANLAQCVSSLPLGRRVGPILIDKTNYFPTHIEPCDRCAYMFEPQNARFAGCIFTSQVDMYGDISPNMSFLQ